MRFRTALLVVAALISLAACGAHTDPDADLQDSYTVNRQTWWTDPRTDVVEREVINSQEGDTTYVKELMRGAQPYREGPVIFGYTELPFAVRALSLEDRAKTAFDTQLERGEPFNLLQGGYLVLSTDTAIVDPERRFGLIFDRYQDRWLYLERQPDGTIAAVSLDVGADSWYGFPIQETCRPQEVSRQCLYQIDQTDGTQNLDGGNLILIAPIDYVTFDIRRESEEDGRYTGSEYVLRWNSDTRLSFSITPRIPLRIRDRSTQSAGEQLSRLFAEGGRALGGAELAQLPTYSSRS